MRGRELHLDLPRFVGTCCKSSPNTHGNVPDEDMTQLLERGTCERRPLTRWCTNAVLFGTARCPTGGNEGVQHCSKKTPTGSALLELLRAASLRNAAATSITRVLCKMRCFDRLMTLAAGAFSLSTTVSCGHVRPTSVRLKKWQCRDPEAVNTFSRCVELVVC